MSLAAPSTETSPTMRPARGYRPAPLRATRRQFATEGLSFSTSPLLLAATAFALGIWDAHSFLHLSSTVLLAALLGAALCVTAALHAPRVLLFPLALLWFAAGQFCASTAPVHPASAALFRLGDGLQRESPVLYWPSTRRASKPQNPSINNMDCLSRYSRSTSQSIMSRSSRPIETGRLLWLEACG